MGGILSCCDDCFGSKGVGPAVGNTVGGRDSYQTFPADRSARDQPNPEEKRRQLAEAAEKRRQEQEHRGVKDMGAVQRQQKRQDEIERLEKEAALRGNQDGPGLRWQMS